jgi:interferon-induced GTP-binding protein Mx1
MTQALDSELMRELIDNLNSCGCGKYVELPQIAVMGDTSSGKSSLLSALSGLEFPSSNELCTRCPTQIIMTKDDQFKTTVCLQRYQKTDEAEPELKELSDTNEIMHAIEKITKQLVDEGQVISDDCIVIRARGPNLPNLSVIDLPGIVRTVGDGEDKSMIPRVKALVERFMKQSRTIILAVIPANVDIHNNEILQAAEAVDPEGDRTIGIITKPDLVDEGAEFSVIELLQNQVRKLKLGYHAVVCRGQKALNAKKSIKDGIQLEKVFFEVITYGTQ